MAGKSCRMRVVGRRQTMLRCDAIDDEIGKKEKNENYELSPAVEFAHKSGEMNARVRYVRIGVAEMGCRMPFCGYTIIQFYFSRLVFARGCHSVNIGGLALFISLFQMLSHRRAANAAHIHSIHDVGQIEKWRNRAYARVCETHDVTNRPTWLATRKKFFVFFKYLHFAPPSIDRSIEQSLNSFYGPKKRQTGENV